YAARIVSRVGRPIAFQGDNYPESSHSPFGRRQQWLGNKHRTINSAFYSGSYMTASRIATRTRQIRCSCSLSGSRASNQGIDQIRLSNARYDLASVGTTPNTSLIRARLAPFTDRNISGRFAINSRVAVARLTPWIAVAEPRYLMTCPSVGAPPEGIASRIGPISVGRSMTMFL